VAVEEQKRHWRSKLANKHVILGYDDLEPMSGMLLLLAAIKSLLRLFPTLVDKVVVVLVAMPLVDTENKPLHLPYRQSVQKQVEALNDMYPALVLLYERRMAFIERVSLFASADILVNAAVRHGLNLVPLEFVLCGGDKQPGFVVSEFLGVSRVMPGAVRTNPWRDECTAKAIHKLLMQEPHEKKFWQQLQVEFCCNNTVVSWADKAYLDMKRIRELMLSQSGGLASLLDVRSRCRLGIAKVPYKEMSTNYLQPDKVYAAYQSTSTRLIMVDHLTPPYTSTLDQHLRRA
jgi:trehalose-6-phosphate synthase